MDFYPSVCPLIHQGFDWWGRKVENVTAEGGMYTIEVTWDAPPDDCDIVGYQVFYTPTAGDDITRTGRECSRKL